MGFWLLSLEKKDKDADLCKCGPQKFVTSCKSVFFKVFFLRFRLNNLNTSYIKFCKSTEGQISASVGGLEEQFVLAVFLQSQSHCLTIVIGWVFGLDAVVFTGDWLTVVFAVTIAVDEGIVEVLEVVTEVARGGKAVCTGW